jgi:hypothetical protein
MIEIPSTKVTQLETFFIYSQSEFYCFRSIYKLARLSRMQFLSASSVIVPEVSKKIMANKDICIILRITDKNKLIRTRF